MVRPPWPVPWHPDDEYELRWSAAQTSPAKEGSAFTVGAVVPPVSPPLLLLPPGSVGPSLPEQAARRTDRSRAVRADGDERMGRPRRSGEEKRSTYQYINLDLSKANPH